MTVSIPSWPAMRCAVASLSPLSMTTSTPKSCSAATAAAEVSRTASASAITPTPCPSTATSTAVRPLAARSSRVPINVPKSTFSAIISFAVAHRHSTTVHLRSRTMTWHITEICEGKLRGAAFGRVADDRAGEGVFGLAFDRRDEGKEFIGADTVDDDVGDFGFTLGEGAGLVHHYRLDARRGFQRGGIFEQHSSLSSESGADHDGGGRGQTESVGAGDDNDGDREQKRGLHSCTRRPPDEEGAGAADQSNKDEPERGPISEPLPRRFRVLRFLDQRHYLGQGGVGTDFGCSDAKCARRVDGSPDDCGSRFFGYGKAFPGHH